jgi:hypothetical protein
MTCTALIAGPAAEPLGLTLFGPVAWLRLPIPIGVTARLLTACLEAANARADYAERIRDKHGTGSPACQSANWLRLHREY